MKTFAIALCEIASASGFASAQTIGEIRTTTATPIDAAGTTTTTTTVEEKV